MGSRTRPSTPEDEEEDPGPPQQRHPMASLEEEEEEFNQVETIEGLLLPNPRLPRYPGRDKMKNVHRLEMVHKDAVPSMALPPVNYSEFPVNDPTASKKYNMQVSWKQRRVLLYLRQEQERLKKQLEGMMPDEVRERMDKISFKHLVDPALSKAVNDSVTKLLSGIPDIVDEALQNLTSLVCTEDFNKKLLFLFVNNKAVQQLLGALTNFLDVQSIADKVLQLLLVLSRDPHHRKDIILERGLDLIVDTLNKYREVELLSVCAVELLWELAQDDSIVPHIDQEAVQLVCGIMQLHRTSRQLHKKGVGLVAVCARDDEAKQAAISSGVVECIIVSFEELEVDSELLAANCCCLETLGYDEPSRLYIRNARGCDMVIRAFSMLPGSPDVVGQAARAVAALARSTEMRVYFGTLNVVDVLCESMGRFKDDSFVCLSCLLALCSVVWLPTLNQDLRKRQGIKIILRTMERFPTNMDIIAAGSKCLYNMGRKPIEEKARPSDGPVKPVTATEAKQLKAQQWVFSVLKGEEPEDEAVDQGAWRQSMVVGMDGPDSDDSDKEKELTPLDEMILKAEDGHSVSSVSSLSTMRVSDISDSIAGDDDALLSQSEDGDGDDKENARFDDEVARANRALRNKFTADARQLGMEHGFDDVEGSQQAGATRRTRKSLQPRRQSMEKMVNPFGDSPSLSDISGLLTTGNTRSVSVFDAAVSAKPSLLLPHLASRPLSSSATAFSSSVVNAIKWKKQSLRGSPVGPTLSNSAKTRLMSESGYLDPIKRLAKKVQGRRPRLPPPQPES